MSAVKRPRELFPDGPPDDGDDDDAMALAMDDAADGDEAKVKEEGTGGKVPRKRNRTKRVDEGDAKEIKPRHLRGKRRDEAVARQVANAEAATKRLKAGGAAEDASAPAVTLQAQLTRILRPKARKWAMYEWFYSPVDLAWFRENAFRVVLQQAGLGHVTHLTRIEWAFVRSLIGKPRRLSAAFLGAQRAQLHEYRTEVRNLRQLQLNGNSATAAMEMDLGVHGALQRARHTAARRQCPSRRDPRIWSVSSAPQPRAHALTPCSLLSLVLPGARARWCACAWMLAVWSWQWRWGSE